MSHNPYQPPSIVEPGRDVGKLASRAHSTRGRKLIWLVFGIAGGFLGAIAFWQKWWSMGGIGIVPLRMSLAGAIFGITVFLALFVTDRHLRKLTIRRCVPVFQLVVLSSCVGFAVNGFLLEDLLNNGVRLRTILAFLPAPVSIGFGLYFAGIVRVRGVILVAFLGAALGWTTFLAAYLLASVIPSWRGVDWFFRHSFLWIVLMTCVLEWLTRSTLRQRQLGPASKSRR